MSFDGKKHECELCGYIQGGKKWEIQKRKN